MFASTRPGLLADVFGIRLAGMEEPAMLNELSPIGLTKNALRLNCAGKEIATEAWRFDVIEPRGAQAVGTITSLHREYPIITSNRFGKGTAIYIGLPARHDTLAPVVDDRWVLWRSQGGRPRPKVSWQGRSAAGTFCT